MKCIRNSFFGFLIVILLSALPVYAATYYVDATKGNDYNDGLSPSTAWKTIAKVNNSSFSPGDQILFKRGEIWRETLRIPSSGSRITPITFGAYGTLSYPVISGADIPVTWINTVDINVWHTQLSAVPSQVFFDEITGTKKDEIAKLTVTNDWYFDSTDNTLWIYTTHDPNDYIKIEATVRQNTIVVNGKSYLEIKNIEVRHAKYSVQSSIYVNNSNNIMLDSLVVRHNDGNSSIFIEGNSSYITVRNCKVYGTFNADPNYGIGIAVDGPGRYHDISRNTIFNNYGPGIRLGMYNGFNLHNSTVSHNTVYGNGAQGILVTKGSSYNNQIENNVVYQNCEGLADCFGIDLFQVGNDNIVRYNTLHGQNFIKISAGAIRFDGGPPPGVSPEGNLAYSNIIYDETCGISVWNFDNASIYNNTIYGSSSYGIHVGGVATNGVNVKNNIINTAEKHLIFVNEAIDNAIDFNCYYPDGPLAFNWNGIVSDFSEWLVKSRMDENSLAPSDPQFVFPYEKDLHLQSSSPCIDTGTDVGLIRDFDGISIPQGKAADIGAYEHTKEDVKPPVAPAGLRIK